MSRFGHLRPVLAPDLDGPRALETLFVAAVSAVLILRFALQLAGYPQVGGWGLHIAHMLWGGVLLLVVVVLLLAFLGRTLRSPAALLAGIGFGVFIDELGKFITSDNNYFFRPTIALIYIIFVLLFLAFRALTPRRLPSPAAYSVNALALTSDASLRAVMRADRERVAWLLAQSDLPPSLTTAIEAYLDGRVTENARAPNPFLRAAGIVRSAVQRLSRTRMFEMCVIALFLGLALLDLLTFLRILGTDPRFQWAAPSLSFVQLADLASSLAGLVLILIGVRQLQRSRLAAYGWFRRAILLSLLLSQVFSFYAQQLAAVVGLALNIVALLALNTLIEIEREPSPAMSPPHEAGILGTPSERVP